MKVAIGVVDDHQLFLKSLGFMLNSFNNYEVVVEALNGKDLQQKMKDAATLPSIMLIDVNMPVMNGIETATWLSATYPTIKLVALSMNESEKSILGMIKAGCCAYLLKDTHPNELEIALSEINLKGYYNADMFNINHRRFILSEAEKDTPIITEKEQQFLQLASSDFTYGHIAEKMKVSERTVEGYRAVLFKKLNVQSRVGMVLEAVRRGLVEI